MRRHIQAHTIFDNKPSKACIEKPSRTTTALKIKLA